MGSKSRLMVLVGLLTCVTLAWAQGDGAAGKAKSAACAACHGADGNSIQSAWPNLAGQHAKYLVAQMQAYKAGKDGGRMNVVMSPLMQPLSTQDMEDIAAYYEAQKPKIGQVDPKHMKHGQRLYRGGDFDKKITACIACHGPRGRGNADAGFPALTGQQIDYVVTQLQAYRDGARSNDLNGMMRGVAKRLDKQEMTAIANFIFGLH